MKVKYEYYCNCCGTTFYEEEEHTHDEDGNIVCPTCGCFYDEEDERKIEKCSVKSE